MEERFVDLGKDLACEMRELNPGITFPGDLDASMAEIRWDWFIADMSDDYFGRTLPEQAAIKRRVHEKFGDIVYPKFLR
jgi:hypothetical protein